MEPGLAKTDSEARVRSRKRRLLREWSVKSLTYTVLTIVGFTMVIPFIWMLSTSFKETRQVFVLPPQWIPHPFKWTNYVDAMTVVSFGRYYFNSIFIGVCVTVGQVLTSAMAAYAFARLRFPGRDKLFFGYLATMMIPGSVTMIPVFILCKLFGLIDTYQGLILPGIFSAYGTFMLRQFFMSLPRDLEDAAKIDGCSLFGIFWKVTLPLSKPALATLTTFTFMGSWGSFLWPLIITNSDEYRTLPIGLACFKGLYVTEYNLLMAASVVALLPVILVFVRAQKYFIEGIQLGAIKG